MPPLNDATRRTVLRTIGAGIGGTVLAGSAAAGGQNYGNGNGIGAFLNERPLAKRMPVWDSGVADMTGQDEAVVDVGTMTTLDIPEDILPAPPEEGPFAYAPRAVEASPGTTVRWEWTGNPFLDANGDPVSPEEGSGPWPHDVHSLDHSFHSEFQGTGTFEWTFSDTGTYLYYCTPHGNPGPDRPNLFGMRGAVIVSDD